MNRKPIEICAFICIAAGIGVPFVIRCFEGGASAEYAILATAGDWLGGTSAPLFSLAGFLMMYGAYKMQQEDLRLTREDMKQTREELKTQNETLKRQEFESTFFIYWNCIIRLSIVFFIKMVLTSYAVDVSIFH